MKESEGERERERERGSVGINLSFLSRPLSDSPSLALSRLAIRNHDNRWEPPPGSAWECSGIIASGTPSTITQRTQTQGSRLEKWRVTGSYGTQTWARERKGESLLMHQREVFQHAYPLRSCMMSHAQIMLLLSCHKFSSLSRMIIYLM